MKNSQYKNSNPLTTIKEILMRDQKRYYIKITKISLKLRELRDKQKKNILDVAWIALLTIRRNQLAPKRNIWLQGKIGDNSRIYHANIIVNQNAVIGNGAIFHGNNCIGDNGKDKKACPKIGNNVEFGYGACVYGDIKIADNVIIGAGSVVVKDITKQGTVVAGIPAKEIGKNCDER